MPTRGSGKTGERKPRKNTVGEAVKVDPASNRAPNADEAAPETLVPDVVRTHLTRTDGQPAISREQRIAERAYELARRRGFAPGAELDDWLLAEREIDAQLREQTRPEDQFTG